MQAITRKVISSAMQAVRHNTIWHKKMDRIRFLSAACILLVVLFSPQHGVASNAFTTVSPHPGTTLATCIALAKCESPGGRCADENCVAFNEDIIMSYNHVAYTSTWGSCYYYGCPLVGTGFQTSCADGDISTYLYKDIWSQSYGSCTKHGQTIRIIEIPSSAYQTQYDINILYVPDTVEANDKNKGEPDCGICTDPRNIFAGNPVNTATGNKYESVSDVSVATPGVPLEFRRHYNSTVIADGPLGYGWTHSFSVTLQVADANPPARIKITDADGRALYFRQIMFTYPDGTHYYGESGVQERLVKLASGEYTLRRKEGDLTYRFDASGRLTQISDPNGNALALTYTGGLLTQVANNFGAALTIQYDGSRISSVTDPKGQPVVYGYTDGDLTSVAYPDTNSTAYAYINHRLTDKYDTGFNLIGHWEYTANGQVGVYYRFLDSGVPREQIAFTYNPTSTVLTRSTGTTTYTTSLIDGIKAVTAIEGCGETCGGGIHKSFQYDSRLNLTHITLTSEGQAYTTRYTYDNPGSVLDRVGEITETREAIGLEGERARTYSYTHRTDDPFLLTQSTETKPSVVSPGQDTVTTTTYNTQGKITSVTETGYVSIDGSPGQRTYETGYQYNPFGQLTEIDGPRTDVADTTTFEYYPNTADQGNNRAQLKAAVNALNQRTEFSEYDANGNVGAITDPNGVVTRYTYDPRNRISTVRNETAQALTQYFYDARGNISSIISPEGNRLDFAYTLADRLAEVRDSANNRIAYGYDGEGNRISEAAYDPQNTLRRSLSLTYDAYNRLFHVVNPDQGYTEYAYDEKGNRTSVRNPGAKVTQFAYDALDRLRTITQVSQPVSPITSQGFDPHDNLTSVTDPGGLTTAYQVDDFGRRNTTSSPDTGITRSIYDPAGNLTQQTDANGTIINYTYDAINRVTAIQFPQDPAQNIAYTYDSPSVPYGIGRLTGRTDASGTYVFSYDAQGNMTREDKTVGGVLSTTQYLYNKNNALVSITYPSGRIVTYTRSPATGRITQVDATISGIPTPLASSITYLPFGPLTALVYGNGLSLMKDYDTQYRVSSITAGPVVSLLYQYTPDGNISSLSDTITPIAQVAETQGAYTYEQGSNVLLSVSGPQPVVYDADNAGNTIAENTRTYAYDRMNRLITVTDNGAQTSYAYNALNLRTTKTTTSGTIIYHYDPQGHLIAETNGTGQTLVEYVYLDDEPLAMIRNESVFFYHTGHLGTPQVMTDSYGAVVWRALYSPFGNATIITSTVENNLRLPGQYYDTETGLHYNWNRYYDPKTGRYITPDPIGLMGGVNLYGYAGNNPVRWVDPRGLIVIADDVIVVGIISLTAITVMYSESPAGQTMLKGVYRDINGAIVDIEQNKKNVCKNTKSETRTPWEPGKKFDPNDPPGPNEKWWKKVIWFLAQAGRFFVQGPR